jgi:hypothetical protein
MRAQLFTALARVCGAAALALLVATPAPAARSAPAAPAAATGGTTFVNVVPAIDGSSLFVEAGAGQRLLSDTLYTSVKIGPGGNKRSYTMAYSETNRLYYASVVGLRSRTNEEGSVEITSTLGLNSGALNFQRVFVPQGTDVSARTDDARFEVRIVDRQALPTDTYLALTPSAVPPGAPPPGHRIIGAVYSARVPEPQPPIGAPFFIINMSYAGLDLGGAPLRSLGIFAWDASRRSWEPLESVLLPSLGYLSAADQRFTTYALMARPAWLDEFDDGTGIEPGSRSNLRVGGGALARSDPRLPASARSLPIALPPGAARWDALSYAGAGAPTVDVLASDGAVLLAGAGSGASLAAIDPAAHPSLVLRVTLPAGEGGTPPTLERWQVSWRVRVGVAIADLDQLADGLPRAAAVTTDPPGLPAQVTYTGIEGTTYGPSAAPPAQPGVYRVDVSVDAPGVLGAASATLTVRAPQDVPPPPRPKIYLPLLRS